MVSALYTIIIYPLYQLDELFYLVSYKAFKSTPVALLSVSLAVSFMSLPLYIIAEQWQEKERLIQNGLKNGIQRIKKAFKGDKQYMILSAYYREHKYHPLMALRSSISLLIQIPFFIAAYQFLSHLEALNGAHFLFISDLSQPDHFFSIHGFSIHILPIIMTAINIVSGTIYSKGHPLKEKIQIYAMALLFLLILYKSPSGLVIYWTLNNLFSLIKNIFYKLQHPVWLLYGILCVGVLYVDYHLLFEHNSFLFKRLLLALLLSLVLFAPLIIKGIHWLVEGPLKKLSEQKKICTGLFFVAALALVILVGYALPSFVIESSPVEFSFIEPYNSPLYFLGNSFLQAFGFFVFWPCCIYFLFGKKVKTLMAAGGSALLFCSLLNAFAFSGNYGVLSSVLTFSNPVALIPSVGNAVLNIVLLLAICGAIVLLFYFKKMNAVFYASLLCAISLSGICIKNTVTIVTHYKEAVAIRSQNEAADEATEEIESIFHLSKTKPNVLMIMLDRAINGYVTTIFDEHQSLYALYDGFTLYPDTASFADFTLIGAPPLYGGYEYTPVEMNKRDDESLVDKTNEALKVLPVLFLQHDFSVTVTDMSWANYKWETDLSIYDEYPSIKKEPTIGRYSDRWFKAHPELGGHETQANAMKRNFILYGFLKTLPTVLRSALYNEGHWWSTKDQLEDIKYVVNNYSALEYLPRLTDFSSNEPTFTCIVNELTHEPFYLQAPEYAPSLKVTQKGSGKYAENKHYHVNAAALLRLGDFFSYLKEQGVWDNTRIIIVADHGTYMVSTDIAPWERGTAFPLSVESFNPLLMVKDFNAHGKLSIDNSFMTNADVPNLAVNGLIQDPVNPFTGVSLRDSAKAKEEKLFIVKEAGWSPGAHNKNTFKIKDEDWFSVKDSIREEKNWKHEAPEGGQK